MKIAALHTRKGKGLLLVACIVAVALLLPMASSDSFAAGKGQQSFASADEAVKALVAAIKSGDEEQMLAILGPGGKELIHSGDEVADKAGRDKFLASYEEKTHLEQKSATSMVLHTGIDNWPLPIPITKKGALWAFDTAKGKKEILNRRVGRNELYVMEVLDASVDAQHEYASKDCRGGGTVEFAQRIISTPGKKDGLYWEVQEGEPQSPLGPLVAQAAKEGYPSESYLSPFHGYYFKILTGQGKHAPGGAYRYVVKDKMILGFALVAYPAEYGNSGVMTFMVNQEGTVYEKDLGRNTRRIAEAMKVFDPGKGWKPVKTDEGRTQK
jgi:hypothetical protein